MFSALFPGHVHDHVRGVAAEAVPVIVAVVQAVVRHVHALALGHVVVAVPSHVQHQRAGVALIVAAVGMIVARVIRDRGPGLGVPRPGRMERRAIRIK